MLYPPSSAFVSLDLDPVLRLGKFQILLPLPEVFLLHLIRVVYDLGLLMHLSILQDDFARKPLVNFKARLRYLLDLLVLLKPLVLYLCFQVFRNLEVRELLKEHPFDEFVVDIFEMHSVLLPLIGVNFVVRQQVKDVLGLRYYQFILIDIVRVPIKDLPFRFFEVNSRLILPVGSEVLYPIHSGVPERRRQLRDETNEVKYINPPSSLWVILLPRLKKYLHIISGDRARILLLSILEPLNDGSHRQIENEP